MKDLVLRARQDEASMEQLINFYEPLVKKVTRQYVKDFAFYEDAMQEARYVLIKCAYKYDVESEVNFEGYVKKALNYCIWDFSAKLKEHISLDEELTEDGGTLYDLLKSDIDIEGDNLFKELRADLVEAINSLPETQKNIIIAFYIKNMKLTEICQNRRCHYMTVVKLKERALKSLRIHLTNRGSGI